MDSEEDTACTQCLERGEECTPGGRTTRACMQCHQVKGHCSLVKKKDPAPSMLSKARKRPRIGEAGPSRVSEVQEKEAMVADGAGSWGVKVCKGITSLSGSLNGLAEMVRCQNIILGCLAGMMEEEAAWVKWRRRRQGECQSVCTWTPTDLR